MRRNVFFLIHHIGFCSLPNFQKHQLSIFFRQQIQCFLRSVTFNTNCSLFTILMGNVRSWSILRVEVNKYYFPVKTTIKRFHCRYDFSSDSVLLLESFFGLNLLLSPLFKPSLLRAISTARNCILGTERKKCQF